jgi:hypothetical protein
MIFFIFPLFPICSLQVANGFQSGSQYVPKVPHVFPIAPRLNHICFAQSPPLLTYIGGPKEEAIHLSIESSILGEPPYFQIYFCNGPIKLAQ